MTRLCTYYNSLKKVFEQNEITKYNERKHRQMSLIIIKDKYSEIYIGEIIIKSGDCEKLLSVKIEKLIQNFIFDDH